MDRNIFYNFDKLCSYDALLSFVLAERGVGKTYGATMAVVRDFINNGHQFIYLRRYQSELDKSVPKFFDALIANGEFEDHDLEVKTSKSHGSTFYVDHKIAGYAVPLSTSAILKSASFPLVRTIIFDEFCVTSGTYRYLTNEMTSFLDLVETVGRLRDNLRVWLLGNSTMSVNPYFSYFHLTVPYDSEFKTFGTDANGKPLMVVNYVKNEAYREKKRQSRFGKLIDGTKYGSYAIDNKWLQDDDTFVRKRSSEAKFYFTFQIEGCKLGVWLDKEGFMYISDDYDPNSHWVATFSSKDHNETSILLSKTDLLVKNILNHYKDAHLIFENMKIKFLLQNSLLKYAY